ncbi:MAG: glucose-6-phosphate isomerase [Helicobacteraceae bacterium]|nr:glucose-6-phosphate isomerase [Helicobacteraceae bacterium]
MENRFYFNTSVNESVKAQLNAERSQIGFYDLCDQNIEAIESFTKSSSFKDVVVIGIGGSALGTLAIHKFLSLTKEFDKNLHILDTTDPLILSNRIDKIDLENAVFCLISKSGTTVETISVFKYLYSLTKLNRDNLVVITDENSKLDRYAISENLQTFYIPQNVGGRFSVLSAVGLLPLAFLGVNIKELLLGAEKVRDSFFSGGRYSERLLTKATFYAQNANTYNINCLFSYSDVFQEFNAWYVQLWGESLGKKQLHSELNVGLTPVGLIGPTDQHSFLQLIVDGKRDKTVTVIKIKEFENEMTIPHVSFKHLEEVDILNGYSFAELINMQADSVIEALEAKENVPLDVIEIDKVDEEAIGELVMYYELLTALVAKMLDINAYDQPGVEMAKILLKEKMLKKGSNE